MTSRLPLAIGLFLLPSLCMAASGWEALRRDSEAWLREIGAQQPDRELEMRQMEDFERGVLFPLPARAAQTPLSRAERRRAARAGAASLFADVPQDAWFSSFVREVAERGMMTGDRRPGGETTSTFRPAGIFTIEELAKVATIVAGIDPAACAPPRNPRADARWSVSFIGCAEERQWVLFSDAAVDPSRAALRSEIIVTLLQALFISFDQPRGDVFADVPASMQFAGALERAARDHIVLSGISERFRPQEQANRAEVAKIVTLVLRRYTH